MNKEITRNIQLGIFVTAGILMLIVALYFIGSNQNLFGRTFKLYAVFQNVSGLQTGNNVRYAGINVGTVNKIELLNDTSIKVEMAIETDLKKIIRKNSLASIGTDGLMGNKLINIEPGTANSALVIPGDELSSTKGVNVEEMLRTLSVSNNNIAVISENLRELTTNINTSRGTLYTVLEDTSISFKIHQTLDNIDVVSKNILQVSDDLRNITGTVRSGNGLLGTLVKDTVMTGDIEKTIREIKSAGEEINASMVEVKELLNKINSGNGTVGTLLNDTATANHLKESLKNIDNSARNFNENMIALQHNFLFRGYFKKQEKKKKTEQQAN